MRARTNNASRVARDPSPRRPRGRRVPRDAAPADPPAEHPRVPGTRRSNRGARADSPNPRRSRRATTTRDARPLDRPSIRTIADAPAPIPAPPPPAERGADGSVRRPRPPRDRVHDPGRGRRRGGEAQRRIRRGRREEPGARARASVRPSLARSSRSVGSSVRSSIGKSERDATPTP